MPGEQTGKAAPCGLCWDRSTGQHDTYLKPSTLLESVRVSATPASLGPVMVKPAQRRFQQNSTIGGVYVGSISLYAEEEELSETVEQRKLQRDLQGEWL